MSSILRRNLTVIQRMSSIHSHKCSAHDPKESKGMHFQLKVPKGTKDWYGKEMVLREAVFDTLTKVFKRHGAVTIDTPVFELREILSGKYGEDSKLIYNLEDQGGELTSLRYDLTVPFARFIAMNSIQNIKRYHIAKVYRRDQPSMTKGRMREFYQCDFDIAGDYPSMIPDSECLAVAVEGLKNLGISNFIIKINHRKILDGIFQVCGVKNEDVRKVSSAIDKLDKLPWKDVKKELCEEKNQSEQVVDLISRYVLLKGSFKHMLENLEADHRLLSNESATIGISEMRTSLPYFEAFGITPFLSFDLSLARGLDYYTGLIYEAIVDSSSAPSHKAKKPESEDDDSENVAMGSILAGGRYDDLVGMFSSSKRGTIPCVGVSFGLERILTLIKLRPNLMERIRPVSTQVYVISMGGGPEYTGFLQERMNIAHNLWNAGIEAEFMYKVKPKYHQQFNAAEKAGSSFVVILGQEEYANGMVKIKELGLGDESNRGIDVKIDDLINILHEKLAEKSSTSIAYIQKLLSEINV